MKIYDSDRLFKPLNNSEDSLGNSDEYTGISSSFEKNHPNQTNKRNSLNDYILIDELNEKNNKKENKIDLKIFLLVLVVIILLICLFLVLNRLVLNNKKNDSDNNHWVCGNDYFDEKYDNSQLPALDARTTIKRIRKNLLESGYDMYLVSSSDKNSNEIIRSQDNLVLFLTGFTGENSFAIITSWNNNYIFVDARFYLQVEREVDRKIWTVMNFNHLTLMFSQGGKKEWKIKMEKEFFPLQLHYKLKSILGKLKVKQMEYNVVLNSKEYENFRIEKINDSKNFFNKKNYYYKNYYLSNNNNNNEGKIFKLPKNVTGISSKEKFSEFKKYLSRRKVLGYLVTDLSQIAWLLNLRGFDHKFSPFFDSFLLIYNNQFELKNEPKINSNKTNFRKNRIEEENGILFISKSKISFEVLNHLKSLKISIEPFINFYDYFRTRKFSENISELLYKSQIYKSENNNNNNGIRWNNFILDFSTVSVKIFDMFSEVFHLKNEPFRFLDNNNKEKEEIEEEKGASISKKVYIYLEGHKSFLSTLMTYKNATELENAKRIHARDSIHIIKLWKFVEDWAKTKDEANLFNNNNEKRIKKLNKKGEKDLDELSLSNAMEEIRSKDPNYFSPSFRTIVAAGPNSALIHYSPSDSSNFSNTFNEGIKPKSLRNNLVLVDTGGQYSDGGTTDVTRVFLTRKPSPSMIRDYTMILKAQLSVIRKRVKEEEAIPSAFEKDIMEFYKKNGIEYMHSTGHGIGNFLHVHEKPAGFYYSGDFQFREGIIVSVEPGIYKSGLYGIRLENDVLSVKGEDGLLGFENLTMVPYEKELIDVNLLTEEEISFVDSYHNKIEALVSSEEFSEFVDSELKKFVREKCSKLRMIDL